MKERVKSALQEMLSAGQNSVEEEANRLGMSKRSLQRPRDAQRVANP